MYEVSSHVPFEYLKHKLWPKEGQRIKMSIDFRPLKVKNRLDLLTYRWRATYRWKALNKGYNFASYFTSIEI